MAKYPGKSSRDGFSALARVQRGIERMARRASAPSRTQSFQTTDKVGAAHSLAVAASDDAADALEYAAAALEEVEGLAPVASSGDYGDLTNKPTALSDFTNDAGFIAQESDPTVPAWAKAATKPSYTAAEVGAVAAGTVFLPIGCVLMMSSQTSPGLMGAQGTWAFRRAVNFPLTGDTTYYLYERTG